MMDFKAALLKCQGWVGKDPARPSLHGVLQRDGVLIATDGVQMATVPYEGESGYPDGTVHLGEAAVSKHLFPDVAKVIGSSACLVGHILKGSARYIRILASLDGAVLLGHDRAAVTATAGGLFCEVGAAEQTFDSEVPVSGHMLADAIDRLGGCVSVSLAPSGVDGHQMILLESDGITAYLMPLRLRDGQRDEMLNPGRLFQHTRTA